jgi:hypothetical protein
MRAGLLAASLACCVLCPASFLHAFARKHMFPQAPGSLPGVPRGGHDSLHIGSPGTPVCSILTPKPGHAGCRARCLPHWDSSLLDLHRGNRCQRESETLLQTPVL